MNALEIAGLGSTPGAGESLASWLRAGPLGKRAIQFLESNLNEVDYARAKGALLYCPACYVSDSGRRRWYSRSEWMNPFCVICAAHEVPLLRSAEAPFLLRGRRWPTDLREEFRSLSQWTVCKSIQIRASRTGKFCSPEHAVLRAVLHRTDPRLPYSRALADAQWHLWASGWPVPPGPQYPPRHEELPVRQPDRLALMAVVHYLCMSFQASVRPLWPSLPLRSRSLVVLSTYLHRHSPAWQRQLSLCFTREGRSSG